jgi:hypothetical protein
MSGLIYTSRFENVSITAAAQDVWEIVTGNASIILRKIILDFSPTITSGVAQDERVRLELLVDDRQRRLCGHACGGAP